MAPKSTDKKVELKHSAAVLKIARCQRGFLSTTAKSSIRITETVQSRGIIITITKKMTDANQTARNDLLPSSNLLYKENPVLFYFFRPARKNFIALLGGFLKIVIN